MKLKISTPERVALTLSDVELVTAPGVEGEFGVLPNHVSFATKLNEGIVKIKTSQGTQTVAVGPAFFEVNSNNIVILTDHAILPSEADRIKAEEARKIAEEQLQKRLEGTDFRLVEAELRRALLELKLIESTHR